MLRALFLAVGLASASALVMPVARPTSIVARTGSPVMAEELHRKGHVVRIQIELEQGEPCVPPPSRAPARAAATLACPLPPSVWAAGHRALLLRSAVLLPLLAKSLTGRCCCMQDREGSASLPQVDEHGGPPPHHPQQEAV